MEGNTVNPANPQRRQLVLVLKPPEFALDGSAATVAGVAGLTGERTRVVEALTGMRFVISVR